MTSKPDFDVMGISPDAILMLQEVQKKYESGESVDPQTVEALKAIDLASKMVNTIMNGNQIDPIFFKKYIADAENRLNLISGVDVSKKERVRKKKRFKRKNKEA